MAYLITRLSNRFMLLLLLSILAAVPSGCGPKAPPQPATYQDTEKAPNPIQITGISTAADSLETTVRITGSRALAYTSVKQSDPLGVVFYFPDTALGNIEDIQPGEDGLVRWIKSTALPTDQNTVRIEIGLNQDCTYTVNRNDGGLTITFPTALASETVEPKQTVEVSADTVSADDEEIPAAPATSLSAVSAETGEEQVVIYIEADGTIQDYTSFTLPNPPRIVYDLKELQSPFKTEQTVSVGNARVERVRYYTHPNKVRLVLDTNQENLSSHTARSTKNGLVIQVGDGAQAASAKPPVYLADNSVQSSDGIYESAEASEPAGWINRIDFTEEEDGKSTIMIGSTQPAEYTLDKSSDTLLQLRMFNNKLPDYRERPLITTRFQSAVDRITPYTLENAPDDAFFTIELRESVPYYVEKKGNLILVHFESSSVPPRPLEERALPSWQAALEKAPVRTEPAVREPGTGVTPAAAPYETAAETAVREDGPKYTGEPISLDFYEIDIKNVLRLLREVSGKNFAVDDDVSGKVTLSFDQPVPWDQALDLILRMNQLGMVMEGNIIRISTLDTIKKEESERQAALLAAQKSLEQEQAMEPIRTEYIAVNYSNAKGEILPHIQNILTDGRGAADVDERTNLIVITDTDRVISQAKIIVQRLDKVTPQVIIEARVVEVNSDVSNELGIDWSVSQAGVVSNELGGSYDWDLAMNYPGGGSSGFGFQFARVAGTPLTIDAQLNAIETQSKGKVISAPKIVTLDNKKATIKQGLEVGYMERDDAGGSSTKFKNVDLLLEVTPHVTPDERVSMTVYITKNDIAGTYNDAPLLSTNEAETEFLVNNGETIVIGGILKTSETSGETGFPILKDIPGLRWLFHNEESQETKQELLIFITPRIITLAQRPVE